MKPIDQDAAEKGVASVLGILGLSIPPADVELIGAAVLGLIDVLGSAAADRAHAAGVAAAAVITTPAEAEKAESERK